MLRTPGKKVFLSLDFKFSTDGSRILKNFPRLMVESPPSNCSLVDPPQGLLCRPDDRPLCWTLGLSQFAVSAKKECPLTSCTSSNNHRLTRILSRFMQQLHRFETFRRANHRRVRACSQIALVSAAFQSRFE